MAKEKICPVCGAKFATDLPTKKFCCKACRKRAEIVRKRKYGGLIETVRTCPVCGKVFELRNINQKYCSKECARKRHTENKRQSRSEPEKLTTCPTCGKQFQSKKGQTYCSRACVSKVIYAKSREKYKCSQVATKKMMPPPPQEKAKPQVKARPVIAAQDQPGRRCHDCGKPTPDYRCPECRARWRKKHGVSATGGADEEFYMGCE